MIEIQTEFTPNPNSLKFNAGRSLLPDGSVFFATAGEAKNSPLAQKLFAIPQVESVLIGQDFVTITRGKNIETWAVLIPAVTKTLTAHLEAGGPVVLGGAENQKGSTASTETEKKIIQFLDEHIRPAVARDGGDIRFHGFKNGVVTLHLQGACSTCPSSIATLKAGVERMLKEHVPEVKEVVQVQ